MNKAVEAVIDDLPDNVLEEAISDFLEDQDLVVEFVEWIGEWKTDRRITSHT